MKLAAVAVAFVSLLACVDAFVGVAPVRRPTASAVRCSSALFSSESNAWKGEVVEGETIMGCSVTPVGEDPVTEWIIAIDGVEADLGRFSEVIYKKITSDAKKQRFQGFRPGTIPPHLQPTYRAFTMDECARETVLEAMQQNNIRPFTNAREEFYIEQVSIPPVEKKKSGRKKGGRKQRQAEEAAAAADTEGSAPQWRKFETMKEAIDAGWKPGQSFSFVATKVRGQKVIVSPDADQAAPLGLNL